MRRSYHTGPWPEKIQQLAGEITELLIRSSVTYQEASDALEAALEMLLNTRPISSCEQDEPKYAWVREPYRTTYTRVKLDSGRETPVMEKR